LLPPLQTKNAQLFIINRIDLSIELKKTKILPVNNIHRSVILAVIIFRVDKPAFYLIRVDISKTSFSKCRSLRNLPHRPVQKFDKIHFELVGMCVLSALI